MNRHTRRRMRALGLVTAMLTASATMAVATITTEGVIAAYQAEGYDRIEVKTSPTQIKVEAIKGDRKVETIYDIATGDVLKNEIDAVESGDDTTPGVETRVENRDFVELMRRSGDDDEEPQPGDLEYDDVDEDDDGDDANDDAAEDAEDAEDAADDAADDAEDAADDEQDAAEEATDDAEDAADDAADDAEDAADDVQDAAEDAADDAEEAAEDAADDVEDDGDDESDGHEDEDDDSGSDDDDDEDN